MIEQIAQYIELALVVVGGLAVVVKGLEVIAGVTPTTKMMRLLERLSSISALLATGWTNSASALKNNGVAGGLH